MTEVEIIREICKRSYYHFFVEFWETIVQEPYVDNWHIRLLCDELQELGQRVINREPKLYDLVINVSPGESKSTVCTILFPVWLWTQDPSIRIISASYSGSISMKHAVKSKDCINSSKFQKVFGHLFRIRKDIDAKAAYATVEGGERFATSTGASVTGTHAHVIIVDDPLNPEQAASKPDIETASRWMKTTLPTRAVDKKITPTILVMQRLHENDPTAVLLAQKRVKHICLPAEDKFPVNPPELKEFYVDGLMNPGRADRTVLDDMLGKLGSYAYAGQFGQQPVDPGGGIIKRAWWQTYKASDIPSDIVWDMWIDGAYTKSSSGDPTGIMVCGFDHKTRRLFIRYAESVRMEMPELLRKVPEVAHKQGLSPRSRCYIEPKASGKSLKQLLREKGEVTAVEITGSLINEGKDARIQVSAPRVEEGSVYKSEHPSVERVVYENAEFPKADADEFVDLLGYACDFYFKPRRKPATSMSG